MKCEWKEVCLGNVTKWSSGGTPSKSNPLYWGGTIPWISAKNMPDGWLDDADPKITELGLENGSRLAPPNSILMLVRGSGLYNRRYICITRQSVAFNQDVKCIETTNECLPEFLYYWLRGNDANLVSLLETTGIGAGKFDTKRLQQIRIMLPPLEEQKRIVSLLRSFDDKIELNNKINENLERQARALLMQWLIENDGTYEFSLLSEVAAINPDTYSPKDAWEFVNYLDTSSITDGVISEVQHIKPSTEKLPSRARRIVAANDVVFSTVRPNQRHFGIITDPLDNMLASTGFAVVRSNHPSVSNELLYLCLTEDSFIEKMQQLAEQSTSTFPSIKPSDLGCCEIPCPISQGLTKTLKAIFASISNNQKQNRALSEFRDTLLPKLMSGEINIDF